VCFKGGQIGDPDFFVWVAGLDGDTTAAARGLSRQATT
jgi:hypothetical protein